MPLTPQQLRQFADEGYLFLPGCFLEEEVAILRDEAEAVFIDEVMPINGPLMLVPRSHRHGVLSAGHDEETTSYPLWTLDHATVTRLVDAGGIVAPTGKPGSMLIVPRQSGACLGPEHHALPAPHRLFDAHFTPIEPVADDALLQYGRAAAKRAAAE